MKDPCEIKIETYWNVNTIINKLVSTTDSD